MTIQQGEPALDEVEVDPDDLVGEYLDKEDPDQLSIEFEQETDEFDEDDSFEG